MIESEPIPSLEKSLFVLRGSGLSAEERLKLASEIHDKPIYCLPRKNVWLFEWLCQWMLKSLGKDNKKLHVDSPLLLEESWRLFLTCLNAEKSKSRYIKINPSCIALFLAVLHHLRDNSLTSESDVKKFDNMFQSFDILTTHFNSCFKPSIDQITNYISLLIQLHYRSRAFQPYFETALVYYRSCIHEQVNTKKTFSLICFNLLEPISMVLCSLTEPNVISENAQKILADILTIGLFHRDHLAEFAYQPSSQASKLKVANYTQQLFTQLGQLIAKDKVKYKVLKLISILNQLYLSAEGANGNSTTTSGMDRRFDVFRLFADILVPVCHFPAALVSLTTMLGQVYSFKLYHMTQEESSIVCYNYFNHLFEIFIKFMKSSEYVDCSFAIDCLRHLTLLDYRLFAVYFDTIVPIFFQDNCSLDDTLILYLCDLVTLHHRLNQLDDFFKRIMAASKSFPNLGNCALLHQRVLAHIRALSSDIPNSQLKLIFEDAITHYVMKNDCKSAKKAKVSDSCHRIIVSSWLSAIMSSKYLQDQAAQIPWWEDQFQSLWLNIFQPLLHSKATDTMTLASLYILLQSFSIFAPSFSEKYLSVQWCLQQFDIRDRKLTMESLAVFLLCCHDTVNRISHSNEGDIANDCRLLISHIVSNNNSNEVWYSKLIIQHMHVLSYLGSPETVHALTQWFIKKCLEKQPLFLEALANDWFQEIKPIRDTFFHACIELLANRFPKKIAKRLQKMKTVPTDEKWKYIIKKLDNIPREGKDVDQFGVIVGMLNLWRSLPIQYFVGDEQKLIAVVMLLAAYSGYREASLFTSTLSFICENSMKIQLPLSFLIKLIQLCQIHESIEVINDVARVVIVCLDKLEDKSSIGQLFSQLHEWMSLYLDTPQCSPRVLMHTLFELLCNQSQNLNIFDPLRNSVSDCCSLIVQLVDKELTHTELVNWLRVLYWGIKFSKNEDLINAFGIRLQNTFIRIANTPRCDDSMATWIGLMDILCEVTNDEIFQVKQSVVSFETILSTEIFLLESVSSNDIERDRVIRQCQWMVQACSRDQLIFLLQIIRKQLDEVLCVTKSTQFSRMDRLCAVMAICDLLPAYLSPGKMRLFNGHVGVLVKKVSQVLQYASLHPVSILCLTFLDRIICREELAMSATDVSTLVDGIVIWMIPLQHRENEISDSQKNLKNLDFKVKMFNSFYLVSLHLLQHRARIVYSMISSMLSLCKSLLYSLRTFSYNPYDNDDVDQYTVFSSIHTIFEEIPKELPLSCAENVSRLFIEIGKKHRDTFKKHIPYLLVDYLKFQNQVSVLGAMRQILLPGVYALIHACSEYELNLVNSLVDNTERLYFQNVYATYNQEYKYRGKV